MLDTASYASKNKVPRQDDGCIALHFPTDIVQAEVGALVKLTATGKVEYADAIAYPLGVVVTHNPYYKDKGVTVITGFVSEVIGKASVAVQAGDLVSVSGYDTTSKLSTYAKVGDYVCGVALESAASGSEVTIGICKTPFKR